MLNIDAKTLVGKTVASVTYADSGPQCRVLMIVFTDGTRLEADDGYSHGCVVTVNDMCLETTES